jgi:hypothetical protein
MALRRRRMLEGSQGVADVEEKVFFLGVEGHKKKLEQKENTVNSPCSQGRSRHSQAVWAF